MCRFPENPVLFVFFITDFKIYKTVSFICVKCFLNRLLYFETGLKITKPVLFYETGFIRPHTR